MSENLQIVQEKQRRRYLLLLKLWEEAGGREGVRMDFMQVALRAGFDEEEAKDIYRYFENEGFFLHRIPVWTVSLSHRAIVEIEQSMSQPSRGTEHFPSTVIQHFNAPVGSVQTGPHSTAHVKQKFGASTSEVLHLIRELRDSLRTFPPDDRRDEVIDVVDALEEEVQSPTPRKGRIKAFLGQIGQFTTGTASNVIADAISNGLGL